MSQCGSGMSFYYFLKLGLIYLFLFASFLYLNAKVDAHILYCSNVIPRCSLKPLTSFFMLAYIFGNLGHRVIYELFLVLWVCPKKMLCFLSAVDQCNTGGILLCVSSNPFPKCY